VLFIVVKVVLNLLRAEKKLGNILVTMWYTRVWLNQASICSHLINHLKS